MITIMTPTYNRAYILPIAYESLKKQTCFDFEWLIVDDGSNDNTEELVKSWIADNNNFQVAYYKQVNGGKHRAVNKGVSLAKYDYFFILDSDDSLTFDAVEKVHEWINAIDDLDGFAGVSGLKGIGGNAVGGKMNKPFIDATNLERKKYGLLGDKAEIYKTEILRKYPFPEFEGENFLRESASWDRIAKDGFKLRWYNEIIYICDYIEDGLTKNTNALTYARNFQGFIYCSKLYLETHNLFYSLNKCGDFYCVAKLKGLSKRESAKLLNTSTAFLTFGFAFYNLKKASKIVFRKLAKNK
mgnify:CR=1 FL=1